MKDFIPTSVGEYTDRIFKLLGVMSILVGATFAILGFLTSFTGFGILGGLTLAFILTGIGVFFLNLSGEKTDKAITQGKKAQDLIPDAGG